MRVWSVVIHLFHPSHLYSAWGFSWESNIFLKKAEIGCGGRGEYRIKPLTSNIIYFTKVVLLDSVFEFLTWRLSLYLSLYLSQETHAAEAYSSFPNTKGLEVLPLPLMPVHHKVVPPYISSTFPVNSPLPFIFVGGEKLCESYLLCPRTQCNDSAWWWTQTSQPGVQGTNL